MKRLRLVTYLRLLALVATFSSIYLFAPWQFALFYLYPLAESIPAQLEQATEHGIDGIIVYVDSPDKQQLFASGWHNKNAQIPAYGEALFKIASIGKLYDAAAITRLVAQGKLSLDQSLAHYLPEYADRIEHAQSISLRMLVQHRSGIANFTNDAAFNWADTNLDTLSLVLDRPASFTPDSDYEYSNSNYLLLHLIMSRVLGYDYFEFIQQSLLAPIGAVQTYASVNQLNDTQLPQLMSGYHLGYEADLTKLDQGYVATAKDVGVFLRALNDGSLFQSAGSATAAQQEADIYASLYEFEHTGWVLGYSSIARYHPELDTVVVQFSNTTGNDTVLLTKIVYNKVVRILAQAQ